MLVSASDQATAAIPTRPIDLVHLSRQTAGDRAVEREVLAIFRRQTRLFMIRLEGTTDPTGRAEIAHALVGSARGVGAWRVAAAAEELERAAKGVGNTGSALEAVAETVAEATQEIDTLLAA
ncbi:hypothetical protein GCM10007276_20460 [Agaricicola taiwanensis]|uniref:HPt domain-containing protein n=1 Tax=Agaricicola taiwanensis TaxID=591372 RepID=A0A8J3DUB9_9RHOB|nr:Hpt domain-containing protein [Agaricicola taiwanensis]GGE43092.1 hypothetical protein GCM10007276_20460 [Agaricicola taiwanensis]